MVSPWKQQLSSPSPKAQTTTLALTQLSPNKLKNQISLKGTGADGDIQISWATHAHKLSSGIRINILDFSWA